MGVSLFKTKKETKMTNTIQNPTTVTVPASAVPGGFGALRREIYEATSGQPDARRDELGKLVVSSLGRKGTKSSVPSLLRDAAAGTPEWMSRVDSASTAGDVLAETAAANAAEAQPVEIVTDAAQDDANTDRQFQFTLSPDGEVQGVLEIVRSTGEDPATDDKRTTQRGMPSGPSSSYWSQGRHAPPSKKVL